MSIIRRWLLVVCSILALTFEPAIAAPSNDHAKEIDAIFSKWDRPDSAGLAIAVVQNGKTVFSRGYGMANLEYNVRNTPQTIFNVGSVSKQFTAFAVYLLAAEGKLSLDDPARKYIPKLPDADTTITIRNLLNHTSGIRDFMSLLILAGWRPEDVVTEQDALDMLYRQRELNFKPGEEYQYSNSNYVLLAEIVARVSGAPFAEFCKTRIFDPLGMKDTRFQTDYSKVVKGRALSYQPDDSGQYKYAAWSSSVAGPTNLLTTAVDLTLWDRNFYSGKLGGLPLLANMQARAKLNNGKEIAYGAGFYNGRYRGLDNVSHTGIEAGYRTMILRFPKQKFSVIAVSNAADVDMNLLPLEVTDLFLASDYTEPRPAGMADTSTPHATKINSSHLEAFVGSFAVNPQFIITFTKDHDQLFAQITGQLRQPVFPSANDTVFWKEDDGAMSRAEFSLNDTAKGVAPDGVLHQFGHTVPAKRLSITAPSQDTSEDCSGIYYSENLGVIYRVVSSQNGLALQYPKGEMNLLPLGEDRYSGTFPIMIIKFDRRADGHASGFSIYNSRIRELHFSKIAPLPSAM